MQESAQPYITPTGEHVMYTRFNYPTKKALKEAVAQRNELIENDGADQTSVFYDEYVNLSRQLTAYQPGPFGDTAPREGRVVIEGPHYPEPHRWYAQVEIADGKVVKVIG
jgi:hypothetical protein